MCDGQPTRTVLVVGLPLALTGRLKEALRTLDVSIIGAVFDGGFVLGLPHYAAIPFIEHVFAKAEPEVPSYCRPSLRTDTRIGERNPGRAAILGNWRNPPNPQSRWVAGLAHRASTVFFLKLCFPS